MNKRVTAPSGRRFWFSFGTISPVLFLTLLAFAGPASLTAQDKGFITLIPGEALPPGKSLPISETAAKKPTLTFRSSSLPSGAKVISARLSLVSSMRMQAGQAITVTANLSGKGYSFGEETYGSGEKPIVKGARASWAADSAFLDAINTRKENEFSLVLTTITQYVKSEWYSLQPECGANCQPRLILEYEVKGTPVTQSDGLPAVQSPKAFLPTQPPAPPTFYYVTREFPKAYSNTPVFYGNLVYLLTDTQGTKALLALDPLGNQVGQMSLEKGDLGKYLLVSKSGRLYIVGENKIVYVDLDPKNPASLPAQPTKKLPFDAAPGLKPTVSPALGPDGSLYFVNNQEVYGLNPDLQQLWMVTPPLGALGTSRLTVGPSGAFVYLTAQNDGLITVNAQTGESCRNTLSNQDELKKVDSTLYAPVVIRHPDGTEIIYAAANSITGGVLERFQNSNNRETKIDCSKITAPAPSAAGLWGQPIPDQLPVTDEKIVNPNPAKKIYAVKVVTAEATLNEIGWLNGTINALKPQFKVGLSSYLLNGGNLVSDQAGERFVWNGGDAIGLYAFGPATFSGPSDSGSD